jgi:hypothetical protein
MYTEGRHRKWRPDPTCICEHTLVAHPRFGRCIVMPCECQRFRSKKQAANYKLARERLKDKHFDSGLERRVGIDLERQLLAGELTEIKPHFPLDLYVNGRKICRHYVDFRVVHADGRVEFIEAKGRKEETYTIKRNLFEATYLMENPDVTYRVLR